MKNIGSACEICLFNPLDFIPPSRENDIGHVAAARVEDDFSSKIIMSDEAHFLLSGYVNKQNNRFWGTENPCITNEEPLHQLQVTAWCAVYAGGVIWPFFFENAAGQTTTVDGARYRAMVTEFFLPQLDELGLENT